MAGTCDLLRSRKRLVTAKVETTEGVDAVPTPAANAILVNSVQVQPQPNLLDSNELTGKLDKGEFDVGGSTFKVPIVVNLKPGPDGATPPEAGVLLKCCGLEEVEDDEIAGSATGGTTTTVTVNRSIDTDFPATDGALVGRGIILGYAIPVIATIISYSVSGSTVTIGLSRTLAIAPTNQDVTVPAGIGYVPSEECPPTLTVYVYENGTLWKILGVRGTASITMDAGGKAVMTLDLSGLYGGHEDEPYPEDTAVFQAVRPGIWRSENGVRGLMTVDSVRAAVQQLTFGLNNTLPYPGDPNEPEGFLPPVITGRDAQGTINPFRTLLATRDIFADFRNGTRRAIAALLPKSGEAHFTALTFPAVRYRGLDEASRDELDADTVPFSAFPVGSEEPEKGAAGFRISFFYEASGS